MKLAEALVAVARKEIGVTETGSTNRGPRVDEYQRATWLDEKDWGAWCAAFVDWCVREAMKMANVKETKTFKRPQTAGAWDLEHWCLSQDVSVLLKKPVGNDIRAGDILIFNFSHTGIATGPPDAHGIVPTIEGNSNSKGSRTGGKVCEGSRALSLIKARLRFTV